MSGSWEWHSHGRGAMGTLTQVSGYSYEDDLNDYSWNWDHTDDEDSIEEVIYNDFQSIFEMIMYYLNAIWVWFWTPVEPHPGCADDDYSTTDAYGDTCEWYNRNYSSCGTYDDDDFSAIEQCCACSDTDDSYTY